MATQLSDIITLTRQRSNMENNFFVTDAELTTYINNSLAELDGIMATEYDEYRLSSFQAILPNDGVSNVISIPSTLFKLRGVDYVNTGQGGPPYYTLYQFQFPERNRDNNTLGNIMSPWGKVRLSYRLADVGIIIQPQNVAGGTFQVWFTPKYVPLVQLTDTLTIQMDTQAWVEYAVVDCAIKIMNKQGLDPSSFMAEKGGLKARIIAEAKNRDSSGPKRVANVRYQNDDLVLPYMYDIW
jgi:hypothetical protein